MSLAPCRDAMQKLLRKDLASWTGLPSCTLADLGLDVQLGEADFSATIGEELRPVRVRNAKTSVFAEPLKLWVQEGRVVKISVDLPELSDVPTLIGALGDPEARLDGPLPGVPRRNPDGEWVWAGRGLTLILSSRKTKVVGLAVYAPTTLERYRAELRDVSETREEP